MRWRAAVALSAAFRQSEVLDLSLPLPCCASPALLGSVPQALIERTCGEPDRQQIRVTPPLPCCRRPQRSLVRLWLGSYSRLSLCMGGGLGCSRCGVRLPKNKRSLPWTSPRHAVADPRFIGARAAECSVSWFGERGVRRVRAPACLFEGLINVKDGFVCTGLRCTYQRRFEGQCMLASSSLFWSQPYERSIRSTRLQAVHSASLRVGQVRQSCPDPVMLSIRHGKRSVWRERDSLKG